MDKWTRKSQIKNNGKSFNVFIYRGCKTKRKIKISIALIQNSVDKWTRKSQMKKNGLTFNVLIPSNKVYMISLPYYKSSG